MTIHPRGFNGPSSLPRAVAIRSEHRRLAGHLHPADNPVAAVVLSGAVGVAQGYYTDFARWLAEERGIACLTYDYRDFGASATGRPRRSDATMTDWGVADQMAARAFVEATFPGLPVWIVGHSIGGAMLPFQSGFERVARAILIGSGTVHVSDHPWPYQALARLFWQGHGPVMTRALGFLPGRLSGFGADLPAGVYWQWRRWCLTRGYHLNDAGGRLPVPDWRAFTAPMKFVAMADDPVVPPAAVWRLMRHFPEAVKRQLVLRPEEHGVQRIGHMGIFHRANAKLWPLVVA